MEMRDAKKGQQRELLARLDRIATVNRGHKAGLHLDDPGLFEQYSHILSTWEGEQRLMRKESVPTERPFSRQR
jgi:hypothetical protein